MLHFFTFHYNFIYVLYSSIIIRVKNYFEIIFINVYIGILIFWITIKHIITVDKFQSYYWVHRMANSVHHADLHREIAGSCTHSYGSVSEYVAYSQYKRDLKYVVDIDNDDDDTETDDSRHMRRWMRGRRHDTHNWKRNMGTRTVR